MTVSETLPNSEERERKVSYFIPLPHPQIYLFSPVVSAQLLLYLITGAAF